MSRHRILIPIILAFLCFCTNIQARTDNETANKQKKVYVVEIFWYGCPHCYAFEPYIRKWLDSKPENVVFQLMPGVLNNKWIPHAKAFFVAQKLDIVDKIHDKLFDAIHKDKRILRDENSLRDFFVEQGVDGEEFSRIYNSPETSNMVRQAYETEMRYRITSIPTIIINGKYIINTSLARNYANMLKLMDRYVDKESSRPGAP